MVTHRLTTLTQLVRNDYLLRVNCRCGRVAKIDPDSLIVKGVVRLHQLEGRLRCSACGNREVEWCAVMAD